MPWASIKAISPPLSLSLLVPMTDRFIAEQKGLGRDGGGTSVTNIHSGADLVGEHLLWRAGAFLWWHRDLCHCVQGKDQASLPMRRGGSGCDPACGRGEDPLPLQWQPRTCRWQRRLPLNCVLSDSSRHQGIDLGHCLQWHEHTRKWGGPTRGSWGCHLFWELSVCRGAWRVGFVQNSNHDL